MVNKLIDEYLANAEAAATVDYADKDSVSQFNERSDRMRSIVSEVVTLGQGAVIRFASVLDIEPAARWAAHHLVELADLDSKILAKCFERVKQSKLHAETKGDLADAMGEEIWLKEWMKKKV